MLRTAVFVSGGGTNLQALIDASADGKMDGAAISLVVSSKEGAFALKRAHRACIDSVVISKKDYTDEREFDAALDAALTKYNIDLIVLAGYLTILSSDFTERYAGKIINVHPSLLPSFGGRGCYGLTVHKNALDTGVKVSGATVHFVSAECDKGPIILQKAVSVLPDDTPQTLQKRIMEEAEWELLPRAVSLIARGQVEITGNKTYIKGK